MPAINFVFVFMSICNLIFLQTSVNYLSENINVHEIVPTNYTNDNQEQKKASQVSENIVPKSKTVLILGNSIVRHSPKVSIGWYGDWGMAASVKDSDFVHLLIRKIYQIDPTVMIEYKNIAGFEMEFDTYMLDSLDVSVNPDILIMKISENVNDDKAVKDDFMRYYDKLVNHIAPGKESVKVICDGFWKKKKVNKMIKEYASKNQYPYVALEDLSNDSTNMALGKFEHKGVAAHPSDKGMRMIGQRIWEVIEPYFE